MVEAGVNEEPIVLIQPRFKKLAFPRPDNPAGGETIILATSRFSTTRRLVFMQ